MIAIGVIALVLLAGIFVCQLCIAFNTNQTDNQLKEIRKQLDEIITKP